MLIDPFVVVAQIINFLILVALLKRFLYKPITQAMAGRSQRIERQLKAAASQEQDAEAEKKLYQQKQKKLEAQKQEWLDQAKRAVELEKEDLTQTAIADVSLMRAQWYKSLEQDRRKSINKIRTRLTQQVASTARKALSDLARADLEQEIIRTFIDRLYHLTPLQTEIIQTTPIPNPHHIITIFSSFVVPDAEKEQLITAIHEQISAQAEVQFEINQDFICGIELRDRGYKISWNLDHYLTELETETAKVLVRSNQ